jgi:hypothetical protein
MFSERGRWRDGGSSDAEDDGWHGFAPERTLSGGEGRIDPWLGRSGASKEQCSEGRSVHEESRIVTVGVQFGGRGWR